MPNRRSWTIVFIPDDESGTLQTRLSPFAVRLLIGVIVVGAVLLGIGVATYWRVASIAMETSRIKDENQYLTQQMEKVWELDRLMAEILEADYKFRSQLGIPFPEDWPGYRYQLEPVTAEPGGDQAQRSGPGMLSGEGAGAEESTILFTLPVARGWPTAEFGVGAGNAGGPHAGLDLAAQTGTPIRAAADGQVVFAGTDDRYGFMVEIRHNNKLSSRYGHCLRLLVRQEQLVKKGEIIAYVGSSGRVTTGPHLHFEVLENGHPVDPRKYLPKF